MPTVRENIAALPRHEGREALLAHADDPHPRKTRRIEWVGDYNPLNDELVRWKLLLSESPTPGVPRWFTPTQCRAIRVAAAKAREARTGWRRQLECDHPASLAPVKGLSRTYEWSRDNAYICHVDYRDADIILSVAAYEFIDLDALDSDQPRLVTPSPDIFRLVAVDAARATAAVGDGPPPGAVVAAH